MPASQQVNILHFSDILCVWAYLAQIRMDELKDQFGRKVRIDYRFIPVYGAVVSKLDTVWGQRGGVAGYAAHVHEVIKRFDHVSVHPDIWIRNTPTTSTMAHAFIKAVQLWEEEETIRADETNVLPSETLAWQLRLSFFTELVDISNHKELLVLTDKCGIPIPAVETKLNSGAAIAALEEDVLLRTQHQVTGSPTLVFNEGRQKLYGNVGYKVIEANIHELLADPADRASWC